MVFGKAWVYGEAEVDRTPLQLLGLINIANENGADVRIGCYSLSLDEWEEKGLEIAEKNGISDFEAEIYKDFLKMVEKTRNKFWK